MFKFSERSQNNLNACHPNLIELMEVALKSSPIDFSIICGHRDEEEQNKAYRDNKSDLKYPESKHNEIPSLAVDIAPYPINWKDINKFIELSEHIKKVAHDLDIPIWFGGDWKSRKDYPHYELLNFR